MIALFDIQEVCFHIGDYPVSYAELIGTLAGLISVYFAARANVLAWPTGIVNEIFLFALFLQVKLYADMFLQVYFFLVTIYGWYNWKQDSGELEISTVNRKGKMLIALIITVSTIAFGFFFANINRILPSLFASPAAYPWSDSFIMVSSIVATWLLARKKLENWALWIAVDAVAIVVYALKHTWVLSAEYLVFLVIATIGFINWKKKTAQ